MTAQDGSQRAIVAAFLANLGIALAKFVSFLVTGAASMLAEAVHSMADTSNQGLLLLGGRRSRRGPPPAPPFRHRRPDRPGRSRGALGRPPGPDHLPGARRRPPRGSAISLNPGPGQ